MSLIADYLQLVQKTLTLLKEEPLIFASQEDVSFFRQIYSPAKKNAPPEKPIVVKHAPEPVLATPVLEKSKILSPAATVEVVRAAPEITAPAPDAQVKKASHAPSHESIKTEPFNNFSLFFSLMAKLAPEIPLLKEIPNDAIARKIGNRWKTKNQTAPITLLFLGESESHQKFLKEIVKAIDIHFGSAKMVSAESIEKENQWEVFLSSDGLKWIIICDYTLWQLHHLMQFYKEVPSQGVRLLGTVPLFLLPDLSLYLKDPLLKKSLWKAICQKIS